MEIVNENWQHQLVDGYNVRATYSVGFVDLVLLVWRYKFYIKFFAPHFVTNNKAGWSIFLLNTDRIV